MRISCTQLESFRLFMEPTQEWMTETMLQATILGTFLPDRPVRIGAAFGKILARPRLYAEPEGYACDGYRFEREDVTPILDALDPRGLFEAKMIGRYGDHDVVGKADYLRGTALEEFKTTGSTFDFDRYAHSVQWRFMADFFQPSLVTYKVFRLKDDGEPTIRIESMDSFRLYPYPALHRDCIQLVSEFADFVTAKGWHTELNRRQVAYA